MSGESIGREGRNRNVCGPRRDRPRFTREARREGERLNDGPTYHCAEHRTCAVFNTLP